MHGWVSNPAFTSTPEIGVVDVKVNAVASLSPFTAVIAMVTGPEVNC